MPSATEEVLINMRILPASQKYPISISALIARDEKYVVLMIIKCNDYQDLPQRIIIPRNGNLL